MGTGVSRKGSMSTIANVASSLDQLRLSLDKAATYNDGIPAFAAKTVARGGAPSMLGATFERMHAYVGKADYGDRRFNEMLATNSIDLAATRQNPELAPLVAGAEQALQRYRDSVPAAHAAIDAAAQALKA